MVRSSRLPFLHAELTETKLRRFDRKGRRTKHWCRNIKNKFSTSRKAYPLPLVLCQVHQVWKTGLIRGPYLSKLCFFYANKLDKTFDNPILIISKLLFVGLGTIIMAVGQLIFLISWAQLLYLSLFLFIIIIKLALQT